MIIITEVTNNAFSRLNNVDAEFFHCFIRMMYTRVTAMCAAM